MCAWNVDVHQQGNGCRYKLLQSFQNSFLSQVMGTEVFGLHHCCLLFLPSLLFPAAGTRLQSWRTPGWLPAFSPSTWSQSKAGWCVGTFSQSKAFSCYNAMSLKVISSSLLTLAKRNLNWARERWWWKCHAKSWHQEGAGLVSPSFTRGQYSLPKRQLLLCSQL